MRIVYNTILLHLSMQVVPINILLTLSEETTKEYLMRSKSRVCLCVDCIRGCTSYNIKIPVYEHSTQF